VSVIRLGAALLLTSLAAWLVACGAAQRTPEPQGATASGSSSQPESRGTSPTQAPAATSTVVAAAGPLRFETQRFAVSAGAGPHDVAPAADGGVWYTA